MPLRQLPFPSESEPGLELLENIYRADLANQFKVQQEEYNRAKATVGSLIESYHKSNSQSLQNEIVKSMRTYNSVLPPELQRAVEPYIQHGPTSELAEKRRMFTQQFKPPPYPQFDESGGEAANWSNMQKYTEYHFANEDYQRSMEIFMLGKEAAREKASFFFLPDGGAAVRGKDNRIVYLSKGDMDLKNIEEKYGITAREMVINGGVVPTGKKSYMNTNGRTITYEQYIAPLAPEGQQYSTRIVGTQTTPKSAFDVTLPANLTKTLMDWKKPQPEDETIADWKERIIDSKGKDIADVKAEMESVYPGYSFRIEFIEDKENFLKKILNILPFVSADHRVALIPIKGKAISIADATGKMYTYYYDPSTDMVSNFIGQPLGTLAEVQAEMATRTIKKGK